MKPPIKDYKHASYPQGSVTQWFALNPKLYGTLCVTDTSLLPSKKYCLAGHNGIDIVAPWGTPMYAVFSGTITDVASANNGFGKHLRIMCDQGEFVEEWVYAHCSEIFVKPGDEVLAGQLLANMGNTGFVVSGATPYWKHNPYAGTHLHLGKRLWKKVQTNWTFEFKGVKLALVQYYNGYYGYSDFAQELGASVGFSYSPEASALSLTLQGLYNQLAALIKSSRK